MNDKFKAQSPKLKSSTGLIPTLPLRVSARDNGRFHQYRGVLLLILAALVIWMNITFVIPLVMGTIFAIVLYPLVNRLAKWRVSGAWKAAIVTGGFAISFLLPLGGIVFFGAEQALTKIQAYQEKGVDAGSLSPRAVVDMLGLRPLVDKVVDVSPISEAQMRQMTTRGLSASGNWLIQVLQNLVSGLPGAVFSTAIILLTVFFLLVDGRKAARFLRENSIFGIAQTDQIANQLVSLCHSVVVASIAAGAVQSALIVGACLITGTQGAILIGLLSFVLSFLPVIGTAPVTLFLLLQALVGGQYVAAVVFGVFVMLVGLSDNIVRPYVLKGGASLHPLVGFVAAFGALDAIGFYGVFIGPVVAGLFFTLLPMITRSYRAPHS